MLSDTQLVTIFPPQKHGGPLSFINNFIKALKAREIGANQALLPNDTGPILLINGTREILPLLKCKLRKRRIVLRLGSPENLQRHLDTKLSIKAKGYFIQKLLIILRKYFANAVIYQSNDVKKKWLTLTGSVKNEHIIYNGVDTTFFTPGSQQKENIILSVEGSQGADPFEIVFHLHDILVTKPISFKIILCGKPCLDIVKKSEKYPFIQIAGEISKNKLRDYYQKSKCYLLTDYLGAGCPNALLEAISCGCVPLAFNTGPVKEIYQHGLHGYLIEDRANIWKGGKFTNYEQLAEYATDILKSNSEKSNKSRRLACSTYNLKYMSDKYIQVLFP